MVVSDDDERIQLSFLIILFGIASALLSSLLGSLLPYALPQLLSPDQRIWILMRKIVPFSFFSLVFSGLDVAMVGILYANQDAGFVARAMAVNLGMVLVYLRVSTYMKWGLMGTWGAISFFFIMRCLWSASRVATKHLRLQNIVGVNGYDQRLPQQ